MSTELFDAKDVAILWDDDEHGKVRGCFVTDDTSLVSDNSNGKVMLDWMKGDPRLTPEGVFLDLLRQGFADRAALANAAEEFGRIRECEWARELHTVLR